MQRELESLAGAADKAGTVVRFASEEELPCCAIMASALKPLHHC